MQEAPTKINDVIVDYVRWRVDNSVFSKKSSARIIRIVLFAVIFPYTIFEELFLNSIRF